MLQKVKNRHMILCKKYRVYLSIVFDSNGKTVVKLRVFRRSERAGDITGQSDFCIPKENRNTVRSIESVYSPTREVAQDEPLCSWPC